MSTATEEIIRVCEALPLEKQTEVADFARFLLTQQDDERWEQLLAYPVREAARRAYRVFLNDPSHPALRFKKLEGYEYVWSVRINEQYRSVGERRGDTIVWVWIGSHNDFDKLFS